MDWYKDEVYLYSIEDLVPISAPQEQFFDNNPFVGHVPYDDPSVVVAEGKRDSYAFVGEALNVDPPPASTPTATPETPDVFHTPLSEASLNPIDVDVYQCTVNLASYDVDTEFIDLDGLSEESLDPIDVDAYQCTLNKASFDVDTVFIDLDEKALCPIDVDDYQCTLNKASFDVDTEFIDLDGILENVEPELVPSCSRIVVGDDGVAVLERDISNLRGKKAVDLDGFLENVDPKLIPSCSCAVVGDGGVGVLERDVSNLRGEKAKVVQEAGSVVDAAVIGEGSRIMEKNSRDVVGDDEIGVLEKDISNLRAKKAKVVQEAASTADAIVIGEGSRILEKNSRDVVGDDEVGVLERDISNLRGKKAKVVQEAGSGADATVVGECSRILVENSVIGEGSRMPKEDNNKSLFDILKALAEDSNDDDDDDDDDDVDDDDDGGGGSIGLLKAFIKAGMTFPRPRWWPDHFKSIFDMEKPQCKRKL